MSTPLFAGTWASMTATQIEAAAARGAGVLLPMGVIEAHGPHLPTGTDAYIATQLCHLTRHYAQAAGRELLVAPPFFWGINGVLGQFAGSFDIKPDTAGRLLEDMIASLAANGFPEVLIVSHHGDLAHNQMILDVLREVQARGQDGVRWLYTPARARMAGRLGLDGTESFWVPWLPTPDMDRFRTTGILGVHGDEFETAAMVRYFPETVDFDALQDLPPTNLTQDDLIRWRRGGPDALAVTPDGYFGAPNPVDPELWRYFDKTARLMAAALVPG